VGAGCLIGVFAASDLFKLSIAQLLSAVLALMVQPILFVDIEASLLRERDGGIKIPGGLKLLPQLFILLDLGDQGSELLV